MKNLISIQILRAVAAIAVVMSHFQAEFPRVTGYEAPGPPLQLGNGGVDLFFVISGFVMVYASEPLFAQRSGPLIFIAHRVIRIVPLYWLATSCYLSIASAVPALKEGGYSIGLIVASYFFIPHARPDGIVQPIVGQGWTLNYEMFFYAIFAVAVFYTRSIAVLIASSLLVIAVVLGGAFAPLPPMLDFWGDPIVLEFVLGMALAIAFRAGLRLPAAVRLALVIAGPVLVPFMLWYFPGGQEWRALTFGVPALLLMAGATLGDFSPKGASWRAFAAVGNASYALYLFHSFSVRAILYGTRWLGLDAAKAYWVLLPLAVAGAIALALALYHFFERPLTKALRDLASARGNVALAQDNAATGTVHDADHDRHSRI